MHLETGIRVFLTISSTVGKIFLNILLSSWQSLEVFFPFKEDMLFKEYVNHRKFSSKWTPRCNESSVERNTLFCDYFTQLIFQTRSLWLSLILLPHFHPITIVKHCSFCLLTSLNLSSFFDSTTVPFIQETGSNHSFVCFAYPPGSNPASSLEQSSYWG